jgi:hypothetical protein
MLQEIRANTPDIILRLLQRKMLDKNCEFSEEEIKEAASDLDIRIQMLEYNLSRIKDDQKFLMSLRESYNVSESKT